MAQQFRDELNRLDAKVEALKRQRESLSDNLIESVIAERGTRAALVALIAAVRPDEAGCVACGGKEEAHAAGCAWINASLWVDHNA